MGIYVIWPAFFTNVTDSYRLSRAGRLRADLGGLYFNGVFAIVLACTYFITGYAPLVWAVLLVHFEMAQQLVPTYKFDGYFILTDIAGVPDLFTSVAPVLRSLIPGRPADPRIAALKRGPRIAITTWVLMVIPLLGLQLAFLVFLGPRLLRQLIASVRDHAHTLVSQFDAGHLAAGLVTFIGLVLLLLPAVGLTLALTSAVRRLIAVTAAALRRRGRNVPHCRPFVGRAVTAGLIAGALALCILLAGEGSSTSATGRSCPQCSRAFGSGRARHSARSHRRSAPPAERGAAGADQPGLSPAGADGRPRRALVGERGIAGPVGGGPGRSRQPAGCPLPHTGHAPSARRLVAAAVRRPATADLPQRFAEPCRQPAHAHPDGPHRSDFRAHRAGRLFGPAEHALTDTAGADPQCRGSVGRPVPVAPGRTAAECRTLCRELVVNRRRTSSLAGALASIATFAACQPAASTCSVSLTATSTPAATHLVLRATAKPHTPVVTVTQIGKARIRRVLVTNAAGTAATSYDIPRRAGRQVVTVTASAGGSGSTVTTTLVL
jgi:hypothetical protein